MNTPKTFLKSIAFAGKTLGIAMRVSQLQRSIEIIKPKPEYAKGGINVPENLFIKNPLDK